MYNYNVIDKLDKTYDKTKFLTNLNRSNFHSLK